MGTIVGICNLPPAACTIWVPTVAAIFILFGEQTKKDSKPQEANVSVAQKWILGGREKFKLTAFPTTGLTQGAPPPPSPPGCCVLNPVGTTHHARCKLSGPSPQVVLPTAGLSDHQYVGTWSHTLEVEHDRERGKGQSLVPGCWGLACSLASVRRRSWSCEVRGAVALSFPQGPDLRAQCARKQDLL